MALPQQAVERLAHASYGQTGWHRRLLAFTSALFFLSIFVHLGLTFGYRPYLESQVEKLDAQIKKFSQDVPREDQEKITRFYSQLANLKTLLEGHVVVSPVFDWLQANTLPDITFTKFSLNTQNGQLALGGVSKSAQDIAVQLQHFTRQREVLRTSFSNVNQGTQGLWQFDLTLFLDPALIRAGAGEVTKAEVPPAATTTESGPP